MSRGYFSSILPKCVYVPDRTNSNEFLERCFLFLYWSIHPFNYFPTLNFRKVEALFHLWRACVSLPPPPTGECLRSKLKWVQPIQGNTPISFLQFLPHFLIHQMQYCFNFYQIFFTQLLECIMLKRGSKKKKQTTVSKKWTIMQILQILRPCHFRTDIKDGVL